MNNQDDIAPVLLTTRQAATLVGVSCRTFERWVSEGLVPTVELPLRGTRGPRRFPKDALLDWLRRRVVRPRRRRDDDA